MFPFSCKKSSSRFDFKLESVYRGELPPGLELSPTGTPATHVEGIPLLGGLYTTTIAVTDSLGELATRTMTFEVADFDARW